MGVIGGADGPTAIFVAGSLTDWMGGAVLAAAGAMVLYLFIRRLIRGKGKHTTED